MVQMHLTVLCSSYANIVKQNWLYLNLALREIEDQVAEGDMVVGRWVVHGTHQGELMGIAPTGKQVKVTGISIARVANGKLQETWADFDLLGLMQQLGVGPGM